MKYVIFLVSILTIPLFDARAQVPPPVDLNIPNIPQQTQVWCWAAVAQQIILASQGPAHTPQQCALVAMANGWPPAVCCNQPNTNCLRTGLFPQVSWLIQQFSGHTSNYAPPAAPMILYNTLASGRPVLLHVSSGFAHHVVVLRGMSFMQTAFGIEPVLYINDPMAQFTQPVTFSQLMPFWVDALVVN